MPPKPKFEKREIVDAALEIARERGLEAITAREVGARLGTSTRPVFTYFPSMEALTEAVNEAAKKMFLDWLREADDYVPSFKKRGILLIQFAQTEPKLFQILFMTEHPETLDFNTWMRLHEAGFEQDIQKICEDYHMTNEQAVGLFNQIWVYAHGICALCATKVCFFTENQIVSMLGQMFAACLMYIKSGGSRDADIAPVKIGTAEYNALNGAMPYKSIENGGETYEKNIVSCE